MSFGQRIVEYLEIAENRQELKVMLALLGIALVFFSPLIDRGALRLRGKLGVHLALLLVALFAVGAYFEFGWKRYDRYMNPHDVYHYYVGAKYSHEHQYVNLYRCAFLADHEMNREFKQNSIRNLETHSMESTAEVLQNADKYKEPFTAERWAEFKHDIAYFQACVRYNRHKWDHMLRDKGYNATPVWNGVARWLAERCPTPDANWQKLRDHLHAIYKNRDTPGFNSHQHWSWVTQCLSDIRADDTPPPAGSQPSAETLSELEAMLTQLRNTPPGSGPAEEYTRWARTWHLVDEASPVGPWPMRLLYAIDLTLLAVMFLFLWWAFGWRIMLLAIIFFGTNYFMNFVHIKGAFMRLDWVTLLVIGICLLKRGYLGVAGAIMAYAGMARIFPYVFVFGMGACFGWHFLGWTWRRIRSTVAAPRFQWGYVRFFASLALVSAALWGVTYFGADGKQLWHNFREKIAVHRSDISTTRVGFKYALLGAYNRAKTPDSGWRFLHGPLDTATTAYKETVEKAQEPEAHPFAAMLATHVLKPDTARGGLDTTWHQLAFARYLVITVVLLLLFAASARLEPYEAVALSFVVAYFLAAPTFYYYVMLIVPILFFLPRIHLPERALGAALFFLFSIACFFLTWLGYQGMDRYFIISWLMFAVCVYMVFAAFITPRRRAPGAASAYEPGMPGLPPPRTAPATRAGGRLEAMSAEPPESAPAQAPFPGVDASPQGVQSPVVAFLVWAFVGMAVGLLGLACFYYYLQTRPTPLPPPPGQEQQTPQTESPEPVSGDVGGLPAVEPALAPGEVSLALVGDVMLSRNVARSIRQNNRDFTYPFQTMAPYLRAADVAFCNLESPLSGRGDPVEDKNYLFNAPAQAVEGLVYAGFDVVSLANNHILDYGTVAMEDTLYLLANQGIHALGITDRTVAQEPVIIEKKGVRIGFLGYCDPVPTYSCAPEYTVFDRGPAHGIREHLTRDIAALEPKVDIMVVSLHWGIEYQPPTDHSIALGRFIIDEGADIVAGHHPHIQQEPERYKDGLILYSMGNFVFDQHSRPPTRDSRLYRVRVDKNGVIAAEYLPLIIPKGEWQPQPTTGAFVSVSAQENPDAAPTATTEAP